MTAGVPSGPLRHGPRAPVSETRIVRRCRLVSPALAVNLVLLFVSSCVVAGVASLFDLLLLRGLA